MLSPTIILRPFSALYGLILRLRHRLFDRGVLKSSPGPVTTMVVGNLELGGTGKTPLTDHVLSVLESEVSVGLLSRGYGRDTSGFIEIKSNSTASEVGDEPLLLAQLHPKVKAAVSEDRLSGLELLTKSHDLDLVVLDDALQHRKLRSGFNILVTTFDRPYWENHLLPEGTLRDVKTRARAAHVVIINKCPESLGQEAQDRIREKVKWYTASPVFFTRIEYGEYRNLDGQKLSALLSNQVIVFSAIADHSLFCEHLAKDLEILHVEKFRDHHSYSPADLRKLKKISATFAGRNLTFITTAKDAVKLRGEEIRKELDGMNVVYLPIRPLFLNEGFDEIIKGYARANKRDR